jgi:hypothetical protein
MHKVHCCVALCKRMNTIVSESLCGSRMLVLRLGVPLRILSPKAPKFQKPHLVIQTGGISENDLPRSWVPTLEPDCAVPVAQLQRVERIRVLLASQEIPVQ